MTVLEEIRLNRVKKANRGNSGAFKVHNQGQVEGPEKGPHMPISVTHKPTDEGQNRPSLQSRRPLVWNWGGEGQCGGE